MDFSEAIKAILQGKRVHRLAWENKEWYGLLRNSKLQIHNPQKEFADWIVTEGDLEGTDWIIL